MGDEFKISRKQLERERIREKKMYKEKSTFLGYFLYVVFALIIIGIFVGAYFYFFVFNPVFVEKPVIEKPVIPAAEEFEVTEEQLEYITNEMGGYKLHSTPVTDELPVIEFFITNFRDTYTITIDDHNITAVKGAAIDPDVRLSGTKEVFRQLVESKDIVKDVRRLVNWRNIEVEILKEESTLALKGYKALYDALTGNGDEQEGLGEAAGFLEVGAHAGISGFNFIAVINNLFLAGFMCLFIVAVLLGFEIYQKK